MFKRRTGCFGGAALADGRSKGQIQKGRIHAGGPEEKVTVLQGWGFPEEAEMQQEWEL